MQYFKLFPSCIPVAGYYRGIILDLHKGQYNIVPLSMLEIIKELKENDIKTIKKKYVDDEEIVNEYLDFLVHLNVGYFSNNHYKLAELPNDFNEPSIISNAVLELSEEKKYDYEDAIYQLERLGCKYIQLVCPTDINPNAILKLIKKYYTSRISKINLLIRYSKHLENLLSKLDTFGSFIGEIVIHSTPNTFTEVLNMNNCILKHTKKEISLNQCGAISPSSFVTSIPFYIEGLSYNTCLNRKVFISKEGNIKNCPNALAVFGNINDVAIISIIKTNEFSKCWNISKDNVEVCKDCEFRYNCSDCRIFIKDKANIYSQPAKCPYNPYIAKWNWEDGFVPVEACGKYNKHMKFIVDEEKIKKINAVFN